MLKYLLIFLLVACSDVTQKLDTVTIYKKDVLIEINKQIIVGVGSVPSAKKYDIYIKNPPANLDFMTLTTCHRNIAIANAGKIAYYEYIPNALESNCSMEIDAFDKKGRHGWGYIVFQNSSLKLPAKMMCNGDVVDVMGASACQSQIGTVQWIMFTKPVKVQATDGCEIKVDGEIAEYRMHKEYCTFSFKDDQGNTHDHTSYGYETYIVRD
jgi:hypothetical protein